MILLTFCNIIPYQAFIRLLTGKVVCNVQGTSLVPCQLSYPVCSCSYYRHCTLKLYNFKRASLIPELRFLKSIYKRIMNCVTSLGTIPRHVLFVHLHYRKTLSSEMNLCTLQIFTHTHTPKIRASISQNSSSIHGRTCKL